MKWVFLYLCVSFFCSKGVPTVQGNGVYYETRAQCETAARKDPFYRYMHGREIVCELRPPR